MTEELDRNDEPDWDDLNNLAAEDARYLAEGPLEEDADGDR